MKKIAFIASILFLGGISLFAQNVYKSKVTASYYAQDFHGKQTSNGERFNMNDFTCAHRELPFDTILKVTNLKNGRTVNVRVNDRGPFVLGREIDLSYAAAKQLKMIEDGTTQVRLEIVKMPAHTKQSSLTAQKSKEKMQALEASSKTAKTVKRESGKLWDIQVGAFTSRENANKLAQSLLKAGFTDVVFQKSDEIIRVAIRKVPTEKLDETEKKLREKGFTKYTIKERKKD